MVLTVDIGNSIIMLGGFVADELVFVGRISADAKKTEDEYATAILNNLSLHSIEKSEIDGAIISSVVPPLNSTLKSAIKSLFGISPLTVGPGIKTGLGIRCDTPSTVGADLITTAVAVSVLYKTPALIVDIGTATKMTVVNGKGEFIGTSIIPGVLMGLNALSKETAQLPKISLEAPPSVIGKNTVDCMKSGVVFGNASMLDGMIDRINCEMGEPLTVYATGGVASSIIPYCKHEMILDEHLILKGLNILYNKNK